MCTVSVSFLISWAYVKYCGSAKFAVPHGKHKEFYKFYSSQNWVKQNVLKKINSLLLLLIELRNHFKII